MDSPEYAPHPEYLPGAQKQYDDASALPEHRVRRDRRPAARPEGTCCRVGSVDGARLQRLVQRAPTALDPVQAPGAVKDLQLGKTTFEYSADGSKLYALVQTPILKGSEFYYSELQGAYVSNSGSFTGPWNKIADANKLANSGQHSKAQVPHLGLYFTGYQPGVQAWYNQFLGVDPSEPQARVPRARGGLRVVQRRRYLATTGPYWNFTFPCWTPGNTRPAERLPDHDALRPARHRVRQVGRRPTAFVSNDGGVYRGRWTARSTRTATGRLEVAVPGRDAAHPAVLRGRRRQAEPDQDGFEPTGP